MLRYSLLATFVAVILIGQIGWAPAQVFPLYDDTELLTEDGESRETRIVYPFFVIRRTPTEREVTLSPLFSWYRDREEGRRDFDVLWPIFSNVHREETVSTQNYRSTFFFPLFFDRSYVRNELEKKDRMLFPIYFEGSEERGGSYFMLLPFIWYANEARLITPIFPKRPQTFAALFPLIGDFRGFHARDRIFFFLWPLFVYSNEGRGEDFNEVYSFLWPFFGRYGGTNVSGFRLWPLFAYAQKTDEYRRGFFLWPLGHFRSGRISRTNPAEQRVFLFVPFYGDFRRDTTQLQFVFPFYGRLQVKDRTSTGYLLALYNRETNTRRGTVEDRYLWFVIRSKRRLPGFPEEEIAPGETLGGGVFPFYTRVASETRVVKNVVWPIGLYRMTKSDELTFARTYVIPFYAKQDRDYADGTFRRSEFIFPFFRRIDRSDGVQRRNALHLFYYFEFPQMDRLYAPLWTFWEREENLETGERSFRLLKSVHRREELGDGTRRRTVNLVLMNFDRTVTPDGEKSGKTRFLFGLVGRHREEGQLRTELLGVRF